MYFLSFAKGGREGGRREGWREGRKEGGKERKKERKEERKKKSKIKIFKFGFGSHSYTLCTGGHFKTNPILK